MDLTWTTMLYLLIAAAVATFIRFYDTPVTPISEAKVLAVAEVFVGSGIAAFIALMMLGNVDITQWGNFGTVIAAAAGGIAFVKAVIGQVTTPAKTAPAAPAPVPPVPPKA